MKKLTVLLLLLPIVASADPGPATKYLMNEPASMLDIGILRFNDLMESTAESKLELIRRKQPDSEIERVTFVAQYIFGDDVLRIYTNVYASGAVSPEICNDEITDMRQSADIYLRMTFSHQGYQSDDQPEDLFEKLFERTQVHCIIRSLGGANVHEAKGTLLGKDIFILKGGNDD